VISENPEVVLYVMFKPKNSFDWGEYSASEKDQICQVRQYTDAELSDILKGKKTQYEVHCAILEFLDKTYGALNIRSACVVNAFIHKFKAKHYF
jgi:hypothetical protein